MDGKMDQIKGRIKEAAGALTVMTAFSERDSWIRWWGR